MSKKNIITLIVLLVLVGGVLWYTASHKSASLESTGDVAGDADRVGSPADSGTATDGKLKVANFTGKLEKVDTGCFVDGECFVVVDGKHVTTTRGWSQETVGTIQGVESFGDLEKHIGENVEVYAKDNADGTYTLYGSEGFYVKLISNK